MENCRNYKDSTKNMDIYGCSKEDSSSNLCLCKQALKIKDVVVTKVTYFLFLKTHLCKTLKK